MLCTNSKNRIHPKKGIYLYFVEKYFALFLLSLRKNVWHSRIGFLEPLVDTPSRTTHFPLKLPIFRLTQRRSKILISYITVYLAIAYFLAGTTTLFCITSQGIHQHQGKQTKLGNSFPQSFPSKHSKYGYFQQLSMLLHCHLPINSNKTQLWDPISILESK